jgi:O-antigen ligase
VDVRHRPPVDRILPTLVGATIVLFAFGSSAVVSLRSLGAPGRWAALVLVAALALGEFGRRLRPRARDVCASALAGVALLSALWSVAPRLTFERAVTFAVLLAAVAAIAAGADGRPDLRRRLLEAMLAAAVAITVLGVLLVAFDRGVAVQGATLSSPARFRGIGENPNTVSLLLGIVAPLAVWQILARRGAGRAAAVGALAVVAGGIGASGSRGAFLAAVAGSVVVALGGCATARGRAAALAGTAVVAALVLVASAVPKPLSAAGAARIVPQSGGVIALAPAALGGCRQEDEIGRPQAGTARPLVKRSIFGDSGRGQAWQQALDEAGSRPVAGYGFGTEERVFASCFYIFNGSRPENSFLGMLLQLGVVGLALLVTLLLTLALATARNWRRGTASGRLEVAAATGAAVAGVVLAVVQSYVYSVGNIGALAFWLCAFLAAGGASALRGGGHADRA